MTDTRPTAAATESLGVSAETLLGRAADDYTQRLQRGERPEIEEYAQKHPQIAAVIRQVFPALQAIHSDAGGAAAGLESPGLGQQAGGQPVAGILGDFRIIREIGRGGMGIVYEAEQVSLGRRVALKVLPFAAVLDSKQLQRFKNEAQAAAQLHHTNIVPVHAVGCERGVHYYAMQFIDGRNLADVIRELRQLNPPLPGRERAGVRVEPCATDVARASSPWMHGQDARATEHVQDARATPGSSGAVGLPGSGHSTKDRAYFRAAAQLGVQAAEALAHAHELGVIHRDIKPSNLLLDLRGNLWITDFGLAQIQSDPGLTLTGDLVGTLRYMSPEQALAKRVGVDHRTDIYSLGATLYELLTLEPVFAGRDRQELLRQIAFDEPRPPRRVNPTLPQELDTILLKTIAKNPAERYSSAQEVADDLRRFLEDKPIRARRPTLVQRAAKWSRRHKPVVASGVVLLFMAVVGLSIGTILLWQEQGRTKAALQQAQANATTARDEAERADREARDARAQAGRAEQVTKFLQEMLSAVDPNVAGARDTTLMREILDKAASRIETELADQPEAEAGIRTTIGMTYRALGLYAEAEPHFKRALDTRRELFGEEHAWTLQSMTALGALYHSSDRFVEAEPLTVRALDVSRRVFGEEHAETLRVMISLAETYRSLRRYAEAEPLLVRALEVYQREPDANDAERGAAMVNLACLYRDTGRLREAEPLLDDVVDEARRRLGAQHPATLNSMFLLAGVYSDQGRHGEAERLYGDVLEGQRRVLGPDHTHTLRTMARLAEAYLRQGRPSDAEPISRYAWENWRRRFGDEHPSTLLALTLLAHCLRGQGRLAESEPLFQESLTGWRRVRGDLHPDTSNALSNLGTLYRDLKRFDEAEPLLREALDMRRKLLGNDHPAVAATINDLALLFQERGDHASAEPFLRECLAIREKVLQPDSPAYWLRFNSQSLLGEALAGQGKFEQAEPLLLEAYEKMEPPPGPITGKRKREALERIVRLYEQWDAAEPDLGYHAKAERWRAELDEHAMQPRSEEE